MDKVYVFVRLSDERKNERELSFRIPDDLSQSELLERGWAIDGHSALYGVSGYKDEDTGDEISMADALLAAQRDVVKWLGDKGFEVRFK